MVRLGRRRLTGEDLAVDVVVYGALLLLGFATLYPFWNTIVISFNEGRDTALGGVSFWPRAFTLENYKMVFNDRQLFDSLVVSVSRVAAGTLLSILWTAMFAYGMSRKGVIGKKYYMIIAIFTLYFQGGLIPSFLWMRELHLFNNFWVLIVPWAINVWNMIVFRTFFNGLPEGLEESAKIDGCNQFGIFFRMAVPLSGPVIATLSLFTAVYLWNDWFFANIYINNRDLLPVQSYLLEVINSNAMAEQIALLAGTDMVLSESQKQITSKSLQMTTLMVATLPIVIVYPFVQKYFVKGVLVGSLKE